MDESHLLAGGRYVEVNPVRARLATAARDWRWSSARAHLDGRDDGVVMVRPLLDLVADWQGFLSGELSEGEQAAIPAGERTRRPPRPPQILAPPEKPPQ